MRIRTASPIRALLYGLVSAACILALLWALALPLDGKISLILLGVVGVASAVSFYDGTLARNSLTPSEIVMQNVHWSFSNPTRFDIEEFISAVAKWQGDNSKWAPHEPVPIRGSITVHIATYHDDGEPEKFLTLDDNGEPHWTQTRLLYALHNKLHGTSFLGDSTFFEGLVKVGERQYHLLLGS
jgi:hypothetical protein